MSIGIGVGLQYEKHSQVSGAGQLSQILYPLQPSPTNPQRTPVQSKGTGLQQPVPLAPQDWPGEQPPQPTESPQLLIREPQPAPAPEL